MSDWATRDMPRPNALIQWKGTEVCADYYCVCGDQFHVDDMFAYGVQCPHCQRRYEVSSIIELRELASDEEWVGCDLRTEAPQPHTRGEDYDPKTLDSVIVKMADRILDADEIG